MTWKQLAVNIYMGGLVIFSGCNSHIDVKTGERVPNDRVKGLDGQYYRLTNGEWATQRWLDAEVDRVEWENEEAGRPLREFLQAQDS